MRWTCAQLSRDLPQGALKVPCIYIQFLGMPNDIGKIQEILSPSVNINKTQQPSKKEKLDQIKLMGKASQTSEDLAHF